MYVYTVSDRWRTYIAPGKLSGAVTSRPLLLAPPLCNVSSLRDDIKNDRSIPIFPPRSLSLYKTSSADLDCVVIYIYTLYVVMQVSRPLCFELRTLYRT